MKIEISNSSIISFVDYQKSTEDLTIYFHNYFVDSLTYKNVMQSAYIELITAESIGSYYLRYIKKNHKLKSTNMAEKKLPTGVNKSSDKTRFIKIRIDVKKLNKEWFTIGEKGTYADITLQLRPDGDVDAYQNLGMITQDVPKKIFESEKNLPIDKKSRGAILGNGRENVWESNDEAIPGSSSGELAGENNSEFDDLPF